MTTSNSPTPRQKGGRGAPPRFVFHPSFDAPGAEGRYTSEVEAGLDEEFAGRYMPDEVTRERARRMHYAAFRWQRCREGVGSARWRRRYFALRDGIIVGNRKLVYRAVRSWTPGGRHADDMVGECQVVLIRAVEAYNPWLGIRFSTYVFTCLMRALARLSRRYAADRMARWLPLAVVPDGGPAAEDDGPAVTFAHVSEYLREDHGLLSAREKSVLRRRFSLMEQAGVGTLAEVGRELGLSKERVRQVQASALGKLRRALQAAPGSC